MATYMTKPNHPTPILLPLCTPKLLGFSEITSPKHVHTSQMVATVLYPLMSTPCKLKTMFTTITKKK